MAIYLFEANEAQENIVDRENVQNAKAMQGIIASRKGKVSEFDTSQDTDITGYVPGRYHEAMGAQVLLTPVRPDIAVVRFRRPSNAAREIPGFPQARVSPTSMVVFHDPLPEGNRTKIEAIIFQGPKVKVS